MFFGQITEVLLSYVTIMSGYYFILQQTFMFLVAGKGSSLEVNIHDFVVLPCRRKPGEKDLVWVRCNPESQKTDLLIFKSGHLNGEGGLLVRSNGSLILPDIRPGITGEYRCYRRHGLRSKIIVELKGAVQCIRLYRNLWYFFCVFQINDCLNFWKYDGNTTNSYGAKV